jgi:glucosamine--fructose-6-phosphate aminotransferase (isomerizing)
VLERARADGTATLVIGGVGAPGTDVETVEQERSAAFTVSHLGALARLATLAVALGAELGPLERIPAAVARALERAPSLEPRPRGIDYIGAGINQWTAAEGALKVRETARVLAAGWSVEQFLHGPSVALGERDALVTVDGGGPGVERLTEVAQAALDSGVRVIGLSERELGEPLSVFPLTAAVQRMALDLARAVGTDPDAFGFDVPGREAAWDPIEL